LSAPPDFATGDTADTADAPDIAPAWLTETRRNEPAEVRRIAHALAELRNISYEEVLIKTAQAARSACPTLDLALRS
jgi:hypothetical protein